jgi:uncharacterized membrane protein
VKAVCDLKIDIREILLIRHLQFSQNSANINNAMSIIIATSSSSSSINIDTGGDGCGGGGFGGDIGTNDTITTHLAFSLQ